jgi:cell division septal protein FtsQ
LEDAVLENRRFAADRIRSALKNTCTWHPQTNWLATTSDGADALIWILPAQNENKVENENVNESVRLAKFASLSDTFRKQNRRVALDHSNDPVFQIAWNVRIAIYYSYL